MQAVDIVDAVVAAGIGQAPRRGVAVQRDDHALVAEILGDVDVVAVRTDHEVLRHWRVTESPGSELEPVVLLLDQVQRARHRIAFIDRQVLVPDGMVQL
ncbi:MAG TPA: hypothetical protein PKA66_10580, partial [Gemmatimonadales bacterium]|nr:hypothetical protein [Gemmatimonadales bacterium]